MATSLKINDNEIMAVLLKNDDNKEICFPLEKSDKINDKDDLIYINGIIFTKKLKTYYRKGKVRRIDFYSYKNIIVGNIIEGIYYDDYISSKLYYVALAYYEKNSNVAFSVQLSSSKHIIYNQFTYPPQYPGIISSFSS